MRLQRGGGGAPLLPWLAVTQKSRQGIGKIDTIRLVYIAIGTFHLLADGSLAPPVLVSNSMDAPPPPTVIDCISFPFILPSLAA